ncbi:hypothetical protein [Lysobacter niastensis]|uniref:DUF1471 domain-containing protein n=1 Tax=Lysobacter niastensis TaxID=380629 RepID=A0ABS0BBH5_9GAMM|nr:hypothetical protein [Lysobacter niastensis]MBF6024359.1 hypothetical protein [Lysobacter niastensis]
MRKFLATALLFTAVFGAGSAVAATQTQYDKKAAEIARAGQQTVSIYVDVDWGARKGGSATELNQAHQAFNSNGYQVVDVVGYTENGDLQGFFVTYVRR